MPRLIVARVRLAIGTFLIAVTHGPHMRSKTDEPKAYWDDFVSKVKKALRPGDRLLVTADANAHVHSREPAEMVHAEYFTSAMERLGLVANTGDEAMPTYW